MNPEGDRPLLLVVDDSAELGMVVSVLGRRGGQEVVVCPDAPAGWAFLEQRRPDLVLLDHNLPGVSGVELCSAIRATPDLAGLRVALFGHWHLPQDMILELEAGVDFVVSKELITEPDAWQTRLREILAWTHGRHWQRLVSWMDETALPELPANWPTALNQALRHNSLKQLRPQILRFLLWRSLRQVVSSYVTDAELTHWLAPGEAALAVNRVPASLGCKERRASVESVVVLAVSLAEQTWSILGAEATAAFRSSLALIAGFEEFLTF